jgi:RNA polymerase sigma-70 factor (ECF subfamily)
MTPACVPLGDVTPYLIQQAGLRASLLQTSFGYATDDWDDLRQDMALDCLRRLPRFNPTRGDWRAFVRGVVRNHACVLASRQMRRREVQPLESDANTEDDLSDAVSRLEAGEVAAEDSWRALELNIDAQRVLARLPGELRSLAHDLALMSTPAVRRKNGLTLCRLNHQIDRLRAAFEAAGLNSARSQIKRGVQ